VGIPEVGDRRFRAIVIAIPDDGDHNSGLKMITCSGLIVIS